MESQNLIGQFRVPKPSLSKWGQVHNLSCGNEFYLHENIILISKAEHLTSFSYRGSGNSEMAYWLKGASLRNLLNLVLVNFPASTLPARAFICRWFNEPLSGYLRTSFSPSVSIKSSVFQRNRRISRIVLRGNTTERARATTTKTKETRTYKKQQISNQSRFPKVTVCFDRCKKFHVLKERRCIHPKCFSCSPANYTWSERNFCAISLFKFASKRLVLKPVSSSQEEINTKRSVLTNGQEIYRYMYTWDRPVVFDF